MDKVLSIIIPTYNMEKYLDKCLTSLIIKDKELMKLLEVLVVIDGARDRSSEIAHIYQEKYPMTFRVIDKENGNYGSCINCGLKKLSGKYVKILDADDSFNPIHFEYYLRLLISIDVDLIISDFVYKNELDEDGLLRTRSLEVSKVLYFNDVLDDFNQNLISMHELTYNKRVFDGLDYHQTEGISYTDLEWCFIPMSNVQTIYYINKVVYRYLTGRSGQTVDPAVLIKSLPHKIKTGETMTRLYSYLKTDDIHKSYLTNRLLWSNNDIYFSYLIYPHIKDLSILHDYDLYIKATSPEHYSQLEDSIASKRLPVKYIRIWRKQRNMNKLSWRLEILKTFAKIVLG